VNLLNIEITTYTSNSKLNPVYRADCKDLPGMPYVGEGATEYEAIASLFHRLLAERDEFFNRGFSITFKR
jgi:hypothetical protein